MKRQITKVTAKGQITIPASLRKALRIRNGDYLAVYQEGNRLVAEVVGDRRTEPGIVQRTAGLWRERALDLKGLRQTDNDRLRRLEID
ncbi:MAG: AbrB/MazE/SpoVT family DNA-binding domain-containing protein [Bacillota bacterium]|nr:AbrB/MazE/SpoVT family DNA-binding domain-containing protein [Bacillota bacterium]